MSLENTGFEPDVPEGGQRSEYITRKDLKLLGIVIGAILLLLTPIYLYYRKQAYRTVCVANLRSMFQAISEYSIDNNGRLPPIYVTGDGEEPRLFNGKPFTWASLVQPRMNVRHSFSCPAAEDAENVVADHPSLPNEAVISSYGMFVAIGAQAVDRVQDPENTVLIAETANSGAKGTYNPKPLLDPRGNVSKWDGFLIGYDSGNFEFGKQTQSVTRLAFFKSSDGNFLSEKVLSRHDEGIYGLTVSGSLLTLSPAMARVRHIGSELGPPWNTR